MRPAWDVVSIRRNVRRIETGGVNVFPRATGRPRCTAAQPFQRLRGEHQHQARATDGDAHRAYSHETSSRYERHTDHVRGKVVRSGTDARGSLDEELSHLRDRLRLAALFPSRGASAAGPRR